MGAKNQPKRILLTGAAGFIGHHFLQHLLENTDWEIIALARMSRAGDLNRLEEIRDEFPDFDRRVKTVRHDLQDCLDPVHKHIGRVDFIAHLAADSHVDFSIREPVSVFVNNAHSTANLLEYARQHQPDLEKFLYYSTDEIFGSADRGVIYREDDTPHPRNPYAAGKAAGEMICHAYIATYDLPVLITRTMNVFGERQDPEKLMPKTIGKLLRGEPMTIYGEPGNVGSRHWLHAKNTADATLFLLQNPIVRDTIHVVGDTEKSTLEIVELIAEQMDVTPKIEYIDFRIARPGIDTRYAMSGKKLASLGWRPQINFEEALAQTVAWTLKNPTWIN